MNRLSFFTSVLVIGLGMAAGLQAVRHPDLPNANDKARQATDGAYRDGLYLGTLAAESDAESHIAVGRWTTLRDRASFAAGYEDGFNQVLASRLAPAKSARQSE